MDLILLKDSNTLLVAKGAYQPEEGYDPTNLALPSYNVNSDDLMVGKLSEKVLQSLKIVS